MVVPILYGGTVVASALVDEQDFELIEGVNWRLHTRGYAIAKSARRWGRASVFMHRLILPNSAEVDHINGNKLDNRRENLRSANRQINNSNRDTYKSRTGFTGVRQPRSGKQFQAVIGHQGKKFFLGSFPTAEEAALAYDQAARSIYGMTANTNFPT